MADLQLDKQKAFDTLEQVYDNQEVDLEALLALKNFLEKTIETSAKSIVDSKVSELKTLAGSLGLDLDALLAKKTVKRTSASATSGKNYQSKKDPNDKWAGKGKRPRWLVQELEAGAKLEDFEV